jgi:hypothetical protein
MFGRMCCILGIPSFMVLLKWPIGGPSSIFDQIRESLENRRCNTSPWFGKCVGVARCETLTLRIRRPQEHSRSRESKPNLESRLE